MTGRIFTVLSVVLVGLGVFAEELAIGTQPVSPFADSEIATNLIFNARRNDTKRLELRLDFKAGDGNSVQIAFGRDMNGDGDLGPEETAMVIGRRAEGYFIEHPVSGELFEESGGSPDEDCFLDFVLITDVDYVPQQLEITTEQGTAFATLAPQAWMYDMEWNLVKITRRGAAVGSENHRIDSQYRAMMMLFR